MARAVSVVRRTARPGWPRHASYKQWKTLVWFVMCLSCTDADLAADVAQTAFAKAFAAWGTTQHPNAWLREVAPNEYARHCRAWPGRRRWTGRRNTRPRCRRRWRQGGGSVPPQEHDDKHDDHNENDCSDADVHGWAPLMPPPRGRSCLILPATPDPGLASRAILSPGCQVIRRPDRHRPGQIALTYQPIDRAPARAAGL
jgi:hypothetical protein